MDGASERNNDEKVVDGVTPPADDEHTSGSQSCPACGQPVENVRKTCPNCGYEYSDEQYDQPEAGHEFTAGANVDDEGREILD